MSAWSGREFLGYHRADGSVGTANYWLVIPMVFCENRNVNVLREALVHDLGYEKAWLSHAYTGIGAVIQSRKNVSDILETELLTNPETAPTRLFPNVDGIKF